MKRRAVTLTEVLVVVLILSILAAILMPSLAGSKKAAFQTVCTSNLKQIYYAAQLYRNDHGEYPPNALWWPAYRAYYPQYLLCPSADRRELPEYDYSVFWTPWFSSSDRQERFFRCRELRGGAMPLVLDENHASRKRYKGMPGHILILREAGHVTRVQAFESGRSGYPCDVHDFARFLND